MPSISSQRAFDASADVVWDVITDPSLYADVAPNLSEVEVLEGEGKGMVRRCVDTNGNTWTESCDVWEPGRKFGVSVDVEDSEFHHRFFNRFEGRWGLTERENDVLVRVEFSYETKYGALGKLLSKYFEYKGPPIIEEIMDGWQYKLESRQTANEEKGSGGTP